MYAEEAEKIEIEHAKINTADASPVDPGQFELETSFVYTRSKRAWDSSGSTHSRGLFREQTIGFSFTAGLVDNVDINISGGYSWLRDDDFDGGGDEPASLRADDFTDLEVSGRYRFFHDEERNLEIAYIAGVTIPTGSRSGADRIGTSQEFWSFNQTLVATKDWGQWTLNGDIGYSLPIGNKRQNARGTLNMDLALGYQVLPWLQPVVELNYSHNFMSGEDDAQVLAVTAGLIMPINDFLRVTVGVQQGIWGENADKATTILTGVAFMF